MSNEKCQILYVEDNVDNQILFTYYFKNEPFEITFSEDGSDSIEKLKSNHYKLVLLDWNIPGELSGADLIKAVRENSLNRNAPIIIITAHAKGDGFEDPEELGVEEIIFKPARKNQLIELFHKYCKKQTEA